MSSAEAKPSRTRARGDAAAAPKHSKPETSTDDTPAAEPSAPPPPPHVEVKESASVSAATIGAVEAVIFSAERALTAARIAAAVFHSASRRPAADDDDEPKASAADQKSVAHAIESLNADYERTNRAFRIESISGGYRVMTIPRFADAVAAFKRTKQSTKLSKPAIETLAIIAYRQPITRAELEAIRGVACGEVLRSLVERKLVTITGRAEEVGRPMLYGTTKQFLDHFGLASIKDLPAPAEFAKLTS